MPCTLPTAVVTNTLNVLTAAGVTSVALFTAHWIELEATRAAGVRDLISKPFDRNTRERPVRTLLSTPTA